LKKSELKMGKTWDLLTHPSELRAVIQYTVMRDPVHERDKEKETPNMKKCYDFLEQTSRSFSMVTQELRPDLRIPVRLELALLTEGDALLSDFARIGYGRG
jgi:farnesyl-diphosphate farnesyltransferase